jgi:hypothetical protein
MAIQPLKKEYARNVTGAMGHEKSLQKFYDKVLRNDTISKEELSLKSSS